MSIFFARRGLNQLLVRSTTQYVRPLRRTSLQTFLRQPLLFNISASNFRFFSESPTDAKTEKAEAAKVRLFENAELMKRIGENLSKMKEDKKQDRKKHGFVATLRKTAKALAKEPRRIWPMTRNLWYAIVHGVQHTYYGFELLFQNSRITYKYWRKLSQGDELTRRQRKLLARTSSDLLRLVPFSLFIIIPGGEFLLPVALKVFPGLLPSTFEEETKFMQDRKNDLPQRFAIVTQLQAIVAKQLPPDILTNPDVQKAVTGQRIRADALLAIAPLVEKYFKLEDLPRSQLQTAALYMQVPSAIARYASSSTIVRRLRTVLRELQQDDAVIKNEGGASTLSPEELEKAVYMRGMRCFGTTVPRLQEQLDDWIALSMDPAFPTRLLIFFRPKADTLWETLAHLPGDVVDQVLDTNYVTDEVRLQLRSMLELPEEDIKAIADDLAQEDVGVAALLAEKLQEKADQEKMEAGKEAKNAEKAERARETQEKKDKADKKAEKADDVIAEQVERDEKQKAGMHVPEEEEADADQETLISVEEETGVQGLTGEECQTLVDELEKEQIEIVAELDSMQERLQLLKDEARGLKEEEKADDDLKKEQAAKAAKAAREAEEIALVLAETQRKADAQAEMLAHAEDAKSAFEEESASEQEDEQLTEYHTDEPVHTDRGAGKTMQQTDKESDKTTKAE